MVAVALAVADSFSFSSKTADDESSLRNNLANWTVDKFLKKNWISGTMLLLTRNFSALRMVLILVSTATISGCELRVENSMLTKSSKLWFTVREEIATKYSPKNNNLSWLVDILV